MSAKVAWLVTDQSLTVSVIGVPAMHKGANVSKFRSEPLRVALLFLMRASSVGKLHFKALVPLPSKVATVLLNKVALF